MGTRISNVTPSSWSAGSKISSLQSTDNEGDSDQDEESQCSEYDEYIREDLKSRVFVDFEVFLKSALHVPSDWKTLWGPAIEAVKGDNTFMESIQDYYGQCNKPGPHQSTFYKPLMSTTNAVLDVISKTKFDDISGTPQHYRVNDPKKLRDGVMDRVAPLWEIPLRILEVNSYNGCMCDGKTLPRLVVDGKHVMIHLRG